MNRCDNIKNMKLFKIILLVFIIVFIYLLIDTINVYRKTEEMYEQTKTIYNKQEQKSQEISITEETSNKNKTKKEEKANIQIKSEFKSLIENNKDIFGWITIEGTAVDYPVVQSENNGFYLNHNFNKEEDKKGAIYIDFRNNLDGKDDNYIIYGHKIRDGTMFSDLTKYVEKETFKEYFKNNNIIIFSSLYTDMKWKIFSVHVVDLDKEDYHLYTKYKNRDKYLEFLNNAKEKSLVKSDVELDKNDKIITLVTCNFWYKNSRVFIHAKLIK